MKDYETNAYEYSEYLCANCGGDSWKIFLSHTPEGETYLNTFCANPACIAERKKELNADENSVVIWDELNITGQGHDLVDIVQVAEEDLN